MKQYTKAYIPYKGYYSTPFSRWQGSMQNDNAIELGANTARRWLLEKKIDPTVVDYLYLGSSVAQNHWFCAHNWASAIITDDRKFVPGLFVNQACSTSTTVLSLLAKDLELGAYDVGFALMADRCSNGPHTTWADPLAPGAQPEREDWNMDNFGGNPKHRSPMVQTAENVAKELGITKEQCDIVVLRRFEQYQEARANDRAFQKRYMFAPEVTVSKKKKKLVEEDEGWTPTTAEGLAKLKPVVSEGCLSFGAQTFPADGNCGIIVTTKEKAKEFSADPKIEIQIVSYGFARVKPMFMPAAPVPASQMALVNAGLKVSDMKAIKTHNPFAVNDIAFAKKTGYDVMKMNNNGSSLIYGHPQGPTIGRAVCELIEELVLLGGGYGLVTGCAAGDTAASLVFKVA
ncbi:MAG: Beta-ketothiolase BktB [Syntrophorhabdaceae bacterium PtaU1.Bin034]|jgi:acetyl-CoA acetyltransferase family protein|nr:MAG: Beta-ketothiolase BktB [Syntrophorhabdaceae bacterium PtaU1.Bin034]